MKGISALSKVLLPMASLCIAGCYYDNEAQLYPESAKCDVTTVATFSGDVLPLLNSKCISCHSGTSPSGGIKLNTYSEAMKYVNDGSLMGSIEHDPGFSPMPKNGSKMSACQIRQFQSWIDAGALNN